MHREQSPLPSAFPRAAPDRHPVVGAGVAVLSAALPWSLDLASLRRLPTRTFGVLQSLNPAVATLAGFVLLDQTMDATGLAAITCVGLASAGVVLGTARGRRPARRSVNPPARATRSDHQSRSDRVIGRVKRRRGRAPSRPDEERTGP